MRSIRWGRGRRVRVPARLPPTKTPPPEPPAPFGLSLSKPCPYFLLHRRRKKKDRASTGSAQTVSGGEVSGLGSDPRAHTARETYPRYPFYPQADSAWPTRVRGALSKGG